MLSTGILKIFVHKYILYAGKNLVSFSNIEQWGELIKNTSFTVKFRTLEYACNGLVNVVCVDLHKNVILEMGRVRKWLRA